MKRNKFNLSYTKLLSCKLGSLVPVGLLEVLPGDSFQVSTSLLLRCAPLLAPVMHPVDVRIHHWFVPHRLVWANWEDFITGGPDGNSAPTFPTTTLPGATQPANVSGLADYYGVPPAAVGVSSSFSALPFRGYALIWNEWYRDQDLQARIGIDPATGDLKVTDGQDDAELSDIRLQNVCWEKDYFTSARPWEQKGPAVSIPLTGTAPVKGIGFTGTTSGPSGAAARETSPLPNRTYTYTAQSNNPGILVEADVAAGASNKPMVYADLSKASAVTVNALREALALQRFEEARARYGSRYAEYLLSLGVRSSDARLQRPEYLGGGRQTIQFSEVMQTGPDNSANPTSVVGQLRGHGIAAMRSNRFRRFFEEHGYVHTLLSVRPKTIYLQGMNRTWCRRTKTDFWQRELETIGQQGVFRKEVHGNNTLAPIFGYQDRYDDYRRMESSVAGQFRTSTLSYWHFARDVATTVTLNSSFVSCVPALRPFADQTAGADQLYVHARHSVLSRRLLSKVARPMTF